jgi:Na+/phosphate symporter
MLDNYAARVPEAVRAAARASCLLPMRVDTTDPSQPVYLDWAARETPSIALAGAAREALRMVDVFEAMLRGALDSLNRGDRKRDRTRHHGTRRSSSAE